MTSRRDALRIIARSGAKAGAVVMLGALSAACARDSGVAAASSDVPGPSDTPPEVDERDADPVNRNLENRDNAALRGSGARAQPGDGHKNTVRAKQDEVVVKVELTHDVICPWCRIGHHRLMQAISQAGRTVEVLYRPFLLDPDVPPEGVDLRKRLAEKYGAASLDGMFERVTQIGRADGLTFDFQKVTHTPNTIAAHMLVDAAPADKKTALLERLHTAYFERGDDIGDRSILLSHWESAGLSRDAGEKALADSALKNRVTAEAHAQSRSGVRGVPFFRIGTTTVSGAQPIEVLVDALSRA